LSKYDSLEGNYKEAYENLNYYTLIKDSILNEKSSGQIAEMQAKYDTEKKEKENQLLKQQNEINELNLQSERKQKENQRILFFGGSLALLGIGSVVYKRRRIKQQQLLKERVRKERERISRDLHDNIGSQLSYIISNVSYSIENKPEFKDERLLAVEKEAKNTIQNLRDTIWAIHNETISAEDFALRLEKYSLQQLEFNEKIQLEFINEAADRILSPEEALNLFRIAQEAINNSLKYSEADKLKIKISGDQRRFIIEVSDNGKGFDSSLITSENHYGLENIKSRAENIKAEFFIETQVGKGTLIKISLS
jgi:signal transduction histidine kinase